MMLQRIHIRNVEDRRRRGTKHPWLLRWTVGGKNSSKSFETKAEANDFAARLREAKRAGCTFDERTGLPEDWTASDDTFLSWAVEWFAREKGTWALRSQASVTEALARAVVLATHPAAPDAPDNIRAYVTSIINPASAQSAVGDDTATAAACGAWLQRWGLALTELDRAAVRRIYDGLGIKDNGNPSMPATANRYRKSARQMYQAAVEVRKVPESYWPTARRGKRRKESVPRQINIAALPSPEMTRQIIDGIVSHQPASEGYRVLSMISWMLGTRPSESRALCIEDFVLPDTGPGTARIHRSIDKDGNFGPTKTNETRTITVPSALVTVLREYIGDRTHGLVVATRTGRPPTPSNWWRALQRSCSQLGVPGIKPYDLRHSCASMLLAETKAPVAVAERLGNSVEVLLRDYAEALEGHHELVTEAAEKLFGG